MTQPVFFVTRPDGGVSVSRPLGWGDVPDETEAEWLARVRAHLATAYPSATIRQATESDVPTDRTWRDAWRDNGTAIEVDMARARDIFRDRIRAARAPRLEALDVAWMRAAEAGDRNEQGRIAAAKQALRDAPMHPAIEAAKTPDELAAIDLEALL